MKSPRDLRAAIINMARHLNPGGVLIIEPWLTEETWKPAASTRSMSTNRISKSRGCDYSTASGRMSVFKWHLLIGTPEGIEYLTQRHELFLFSNAEYIEAINAAGLDVTYDEKGLMNRGLFIGTSITLKPNRGSSAGGVSYGNQRDGACDSDRLQLRGVAAVLQKASALPRDEAGDRHQQMFYCVGGRTALGIMPSEEKYRDEKFAQRRVGLHHLCFRARTREDIDAAYQSLREFGAKIVHPPEEGSWAPGYYSVLFEDPDGIRLEMNFVPGKGCWPISRSSAKRKPTREGDTQSSDSRCGPATKVLA